MSKEDIRWYQRMDNYTKALSKLSEAVEYVQNQLETHNVELEDTETEDVVDQIIKEGLIQRFEYTYEMAWNVMKDYALYQGNSEIAGSRDAIRYAFSTDLIVDGELWMDMIKSRIKTTHTYNEETANEIYYKIINNYHPAFLTFKTKMEEKRSDEQQDLL